MSHVILDTQEITYVIDIRHQTVKFADTFIFQKINNFACG